METERIALRQRERERLGVLQEVKRKQPTQMGGSAIPTITSPDQAQAFVDACIAEGSDCIKIIHDDGSTWTWTTTRVPMLDTAILRALVTAAHKRGKPLWFHVLSEQQARDALEAGAMAWLICSPGIP
jgi:imidazolonepropionase-like amidohydrolase